MLAWIAAVVPLPREGDPTPYTGPLAFALTRDPDLMLTCQAILQTGAHVVILQSDLDGLEEVDFMACLN